MERTLLPILISVWLTACQPTETRQEATDAPQTTAPASPARRPDVARLGYTSEETKLLAQPDFGAPTVLTVEPLATVEVLDTTDAFFYRARVTSQGQEVTGYIDRVYLADDLATATSLHEKRGRR